MCTIQRNIAALDRQKFKKIKNPKPKIKNQKFEKKTSQIFLVQSEATFPFPFTKKAMQIEGRTDEKYALYSC